MIVSSIHRSVFLVHSYLAETDNGIFKQILKGKMDLESEPWPHISDSAKDLIKKMLHRDPRSRISAHEVLCESYTRLVMMTKSN